MERCPKCKTKLSGDESFCPECGTKLSGRENFSVVEPEIEAYESYGPKLLPQEILSSGEQPIYETRPLLWVQLLSPILFLFFIGIPGIVLFIVAQTYKPGPFNADEALELAMMRGFGWLGLALFLIALIWIVGRWLRWRYTTYAITNRRILRQTGVISRSYVDCSLGRIQNVYVDIPILGRIFGYGNLGITTAGTAGIEIMWPGVREPRRVQRLLNEAIERYERKELRSAHATAQDKCPFCGAKIQPGDTFCVNCGKQIRAGLPKPMVAINRCPFCGVEVQPDDIYCTNCGGKLKEIKEWEEVKK